MIIRIDLILYHVFPLVFIKNVSTIPELGNLSIISNIISHITDIIVAKRGVAHQRNYFKLCKNRSPDRIYPKN